MEPDKPDDPEMPAAKPAGKPKPPPLSLSPPLPSVSPAQAV